MRQVVFFLFFFPLISFADWRKVSSDSFSLDPPPTKGSALYEKDFDALFRYQQTRSKESCRLASRQEHPTFEAFFANEESPLLSSEADVSKELVSDVMALTIRISGYFKAQYGRKRPYGENPEIEPCVRKVSGAKSYPSSHASSAMAGACVLAKIFPAKREDLLEYGKSLGELRVIVGLHHPSDVKAGQDLGMAICKFLLQDSDFQRELSDIK